MSIYKVLIVSEEYREIEADDAQMAIEVCRQRYMNNEYKLDAKPSFLCEECDLIEEANHASIC